MAGLPKHIESSESSSVGHWNPNAIPLLQRPVIRVAIVGFPCLGVAAWLIPNFLQLRGYVNLTASRIVLACIALVVCIPVLVFAANLRRSRVLARVLGLLIIVGIALTVDRITLPDKHVVVSATATVPIDQTSIQQNKLPAKEEHGIPAHKSVGKDTSTIDNSSHTSLVEIAGGGKFTGLQMENNTVVGSQSAPGHYPVAGFDTSRGVVSNVHIHDMHVCHPHYWSEFLTCIAVDPNDAKLLLDRFGAGLERQLGDSPNAHECIVQFREAANGSLNSADTVAYLREHKPSCLADTPGAIR